MCVNDDYMSQCKPDSESFLRMLNDARGKQKYNF